MSLILLLEQTPPAPVPQPPVATTLYFTDETTLNPLPPGISVTIYESGAAQTPANIVAQGYTQVDGSFTFDATAIPYVAVLSGRQAPQ